MRKLLGLLFLLSVAALAREPTGPSTHGYLQRPHYMDESAFTLNKTGIPAFLSGADAGATYWSPGDGGAWTAAAGSKVEVGALGISTDGGVKADVLQGVNNQYSQILMNGNGNELRLRYTGGASCMLAVNDTSVRSSSACPFNIEYAGTSVVTGSLTAKNLGSLTAPTISAGFCTSPSVNEPNGTFGWRLLTGTSCTGVTSGTFSFPYNAPHGWICHCQNAGGVTTYLNMSGNTASTCSLNSFSRTTGLIADTVATESHFCTAVPY